MEQVTKPVMVDMATLLKYEAKRTSKGLFLTAILPLIGLACFTGISVIPLDAVRVLGLTMSVLCFVGILVMPFIYLVFDYWRCGYGATAYLTHSMPVAGGKIFLTKLFWSSITYLLALALAFGGGVIILLGISHNLGIPFKTIWDQIFHNTNSLPGWIIVAAILYLVASVAYGLAFFYFSISLGFESWMQRFGKGGPVIVGIVLYVATQLIGLAALLIPVGLQTYPDFKPTNFDIFNMPDGAAFMPLGVYIIPFLMLAVLTWRTWRSWQSKISM